MPERDPALTAWVDQFWAAIRDKAAALLVASDASGLDPLATSLEDETGEVYRLAFADGAFYLTRLSDQQGFPIDVTKLGL